MPTRTHSCHFSVAEFETVTHFEAVICIIYLLKSESLYRKCPYGRSSPSYPELVPFVIRRAPSFRFTSSRTEPSTCLAVPSVASACHPDISTHTQSDLTMNKDSFREDATRLADTTREKAAETFQEIKLAGNQLVDKLRELVEEGNVRRIVLKKDNRVLFELPLTVGVGAGAAAVLVSPMLAAVGAVAALVSDVTLVVERDDSPPRPADLRDSGETSTITDESALDQSASDQSASDGETTEDATEDA